LHKSQERAEGRNIQASSNVMHIDWQIGTTVSEEPATPVCRLMVADSSEMSVP